MSIRTSCLLLICFLISACENTRMYHSYRHIPAEGWCKGDTLLFQFQVNDSLTNDSTPGLYNLELLVRNNVNYKYQQLVVYVESNFPDTAVWRQDTLSLEIADANGRWLGKGISGLYENPAMIDAAYLQNPHLFTFKVASAMSDSIIEGLNDIGFIVYKEN